MPRRVRSRLLLAVTVIAWALAVLSLSTRTAAAAETAAAPAEQRSLVLILHSYGPGMWVNNLQRGLAEGLGAGGAPIDLYVDYMDTRRVENREYLDGLKQLYQLKYQRFHFNLVIACDDNAYAFALEHHRSLWPGAPLVFCGLDELHPEQFATHENVTGISENNDLSPLLAALPRMLPQVRTLLLIGDDSPYSQRLTASITRDLPAAAPRVHLDHLAGLPAAEVIRRLETAPLDSAVFYLSLWRDQDGRFIPSTEAQRIIQRSRVPVFAVRENFVGHGALASSYVDGEEHGRAAAAIALQILRGVPVSRLPPSVGPARQIAFHAPGLTRFHIPRSTLPPGSQLLNAPFSFYQQYRTRVWITLGIIGVLAGLVLILVMNIVQRRRAVAQLRASESRFHAIFDQTFQLAGLLDIDGRLVTVNSTALTFAGCTEEEVRGHFFWATPWWQHDPAEQERVETAVRRAAQGEVVRFETHHRRADGELRTVDFTIKPIRDPDGRMRYLLPEGRDITDPRRTEENLHAVLGSAPLILWATDLAGRFTLSVGSGLSALGLKPNEVVGKNIFEFYRDYPDIIACFKRALAGESVRALNTIGARTFEAHYAPEFGPTGKVVGTKGVAIDATDRLQAQATRLQLATAVEQAAEEIILTDARGVIQYVNPAFERITGFSREESVGRTSRILKSGHHDAAFYHELWATISGGRVWVGRFTNRRKDGSLFLEDATITPLLGDDHKVQGYVAVKRDVTQQVQLEEALRQTQRTEAIGKLAGGVAHDFNNILQVIKANVMFSRELTADQKELDEYLEQIDQAASRAAGLTRQLLAFGRKQALQFTVIDPSVVIADILKLIRRLIGADIQIDLATDTGLAPVRADTGQLEQVVLNLCVNARDAMPSGGRLLLELRNVELSAAHLPHEYALLPGRYVEFVVSDTGTGMDAATAARIFEPFFTTKAVGQGTGLGLSVVQGIVHQHEGFIRVESQPGHGTAFHVYLPAARTAPAAPATPAAPVPRSLAGEGETILLAEDDPSVRSAAARILELHGYRLIIAADGEEALLLGTRHLAQLSVVVFDVVMPRLNGIEAARRLRQLNPSLPVVLCSGFASGLPSGGLENSTLVQKPYTAEELFAAIQSELKKRSTARPA